MYVHDRTDKVFSKNNIREQGNSQGSCHGRSGTKRRGQGGCNNLKETGQDKGRHNFMTSKLSYILIGDDRGRNHLVRKAKEQQAEKEQGIAVKTWRTRLKAQEQKDDLQLSGLYQWANAFAIHGKSGTVDPLWRKDDLEEYDIIHINMTPSNLQHLSVIREELGTSSSTKIVCNVDLDLSLWSQSFSYYTPNLIRELKQADVLFHVEGFGAMVLSHLMDRKVHVCPHPVDVKGLYDYIRKEREPMIGTIFHRYTAETLISYTAQRNIPLRRVLFGYTPIGKQAMVSNAGMFDQVIMYQSYKDHINEISKSAVGCDLYSGYTYGRQVIEFAALGIPAVVSSTIEASARLFPETAVHPFDTKGAEDKFRLLLEKEDAANDVILHAHEGCKYYSLQNSYDRFIEMIES